MQLHVAEVLRQIHNLGVVGDALISDVNRDSAESAK